MLNSTTLWIAAIRIWHPPFASDPLAHGPLRSALLFGRRAPAPMPRNPFMSAVASPEGPAVRDPELKRIAAPSLTIDRHHIGMAGEHDARAVARADGREEIGLASALSLDEF